MASLARSFVAVLRNAALRWLLLLALAAATAFPLYDYLVAYPRFIELLTRFTADDAERTAHHLARELDAGALPLGRDSLPTAFERHAEAVRRDLRLEKLKLFAPSGEVVFSTDPQELGSVNRAPYFHEVVMQGRPYTRIVRKDATSAEGEAVERDVVECYVPLVRDGEVLGAFEIYYDMADRRGALDRLLRQAFGPLLAMAVVLLAAALTALLLAARAERERRHAEHALRESEARFRNIAATAQDGIVEMDGAGRVAYWNAAAERIFGLSAAAAIGRDLHELVAPERLRPLCRRRFARFQASGEGALVGATTELVGRHGDGREIPLEISVAAFAGRGGRGAVGIVRDISARKEAEQRLKLGASVIEHAHQGIMITDARACIRQVNPAFTRLTGYSAGEAIGCSPRLLRSGRHDGAFYQALWRALAGAGHWQGEIWNRRKDGALYPEWLSISAIRDARGEVTHYVGMFSDISPLKAAEADLERLAFYDPLTRVPNRLLFRERLQQAMKETRRRGAGWVTALLFLDLDHFKAVNDRLGHAAGDRVLQEVAERLTALVRDTDTVARLGGDEFAVVLAPLPDTAVVSRIAGQIIDALTRPLVAVGDGGGRVGTSIGIAYYPEHAQGFDALVRRADAAMYRAKQAGRNRWAF